MMYALVSVVEREVLLSCISHEKKNVLESMREELMKNIRENGGEYEEDEVYFGLDNGEIGLKYDSAYSNLDDDKNCDWYVVELDIMNALHFTDIEKIWLRELLDTERGQQLGMAKLEHIAALGSLTNEEAVMHESNSIAHRAYANKLETFVTKVV